MTLQMLQRTSANDFFPRNSGTIDLVNRIAAILINYKLYSETIHGFYYQQYHELEEITMPPLKINKEQMECTPKTGHIGLEY